MKARALLLLAALALASAAATPAARAELTVNATSDGLPVALSPEQAARQARAAHLQTEDDPATRGNWIKNPNAWQLFVEGAVMAIPAYFLGVAMHEGSHALAVVINGGTVEDLSILPGSIDGNFTFGQTSWRGHFTRDQQIAISMAPKVTDLAVMGTYTALFETGAYPENKHLQLVLVVVATMAWVDFTKDLIPYSDASDAQRTMDRLGWSPGEQIAGRIGWGAIALAGAVEIGRGMYRLFSHQKYKRGLTKFGSPVVSTNYIGWSGTW